MKQRYTATKDELNMARSTGKMSCPKCKDPMQFIKAENTGKDEYYCAKCHVSIPAFRK